jgi:hypothetical protein
MRKTHVGYKLYGFDDAVMDQLADHNSRYYDGGLGGWFKGMNAFDRIYGGIEKGYEDASRIIASLRRDKNHNIIESIKIITHSMGGLYGKGFVLGLQRYLSEHPELKKQVRITLVADFDPFQGDYTDADANIYTQNFMHKSGKGRKNSDGLDWLANEKERGADYYREDDKEAGHAIFSFFNDIKRLKEGTYVWDENRKTWVCQNCK